jgi:hypothetical protein
VWGLGFGIKGRVSCGDTHMMELKMSAKSEESGNGGGSVR